MTRRYLRLGACARRLSLRARAPLLGCGRGCSSVRRRRRLLRQLAARGGEVRLRGRRACGRVGGGRARGLAGAQPLQRLRQVRGGRLQLRQRARAAAHAGCQRARRAAGVPARALRVFTSALFVVAPCPAGLLWLSTLLTRCGLLATVSHASVWRARAIDPVQYLVLLPRLL